MILGPNGYKANTETTFDPRLMVMLRALSDVLAQNGLGLFCAKCQRLGLPDGVRADNVEGSDTFKLICGCATRVFHATTGKEKVILQ